jgi:hypothetical protein
MNYLNLPIIIEPWFVAGSTFFIYTINRFPRKLSPVNGEINISNQVAWILVNRNLIFFFLFIAVGILFTSIFFLKYQSLKWLLLAFFLSFFYNRKIIYIGKWTSLREIPLVKNLIISLIWAFSVVYLPILQNKLTFSKEVFLLLILLFSFIFLLTIPFDAKDNEYDSSYNVKTLSSYMGNKLNLFAIVILVLSCNYCIYALELRLYFYVFLFIISTISILAVKPRKDFWYFLVLDGSIGLLGVLLYLSTAF